MSFKDCVNTKDCGKMQTDIEDVKDAISGITDDVETINDTTIPAIEDDIATITETTIPAIDDRITTLENTVTTTGKWIRVNNGDWANYSTNGYANKELLIRLKTFFELYNPEGTMLNSNSFIEYFRICNGDVFGETGIATNQYVSTSGYRTITYPVDSIYVTTGTVGIALDNTELLTGNSVKITRNNAVVGKQGSTQIYSIHTQPIMVSKTSAGDSFIELYYLETN